MLYVALLLKSNQIATLLTQNMLPSRYGVQRLCSTFERTRARCSCLDKMIDFRELHVHSYFLFFPSYFQYYTAGTVRTVLESD